MNCEFARGVLLASASIAALMMGIVEAGAEVFIVPATGWYDFAVGGAPGGGPGGDGALVGGELFLTARTTLDIVVGDAGGGAFAFGNGSGGSGGGGSFVFGAGGLLFAAGGGGGGAFVGGAGGPGIGSPGGTGSYNGAGGFGVPRGYPGTGPDYVPGLPAQSGSFPNGGQGAQACFATGGCFPVAPRGGYGGGGGAGYGGGGGGGGALGGAAGQGGYSVFSGRDSFGITGGNPGNGYVSIDFVGSSVPESSTWAMMLAGFSALGGMLLRRGRKAITPA